LACGPGEKLATRKVRPSLVRAAETVAPGGMGLSGVAMSSSTSSLRGDAGRASNPGGVCKC
jgi:hypothetical protein